MFQEQLNSYIEQMRNNNNIFVSANKSKSTYMLQQEKYAKENVNYSTSTVLSKKRHKNYQSLKERSKSVKK